MKFRPTAKFNVQALSVLATRCGLAALLVGSIFLSSCASERQNLRLAQDAVVLFHSQLDSEQHSAIYQAGSAPMKEGKSEPDFVRLLQSVHQTLGAVQNSAPNGTTFQLAQGTIRLDYDTRFARGLGREEFVWQFSGNRALLSSYKIDSKQLQPK